MKLKYLPIVVGITVGLFLAWLARSEGERFRNSALLETALEVVDDPAQKTVEAVGVVSAGAGKPQGKAKNTADTAGKHTETLNDKATEAPGKVLRDVGSIAPKDPVPPADESKSGGKHSTPEQPPVNPDPASPSKSASLSGSDATKRPAEQGPGSAQPTPPAEPERVPQAASSPAHTAAPYENPSPSKPEANKAQAADPIESIFNAGEKIAGTLDKQAQAVFALSDADEIQIGGDLHTQVLLSEKLWTSPGTLSRVERLAKPLLEARAHKNITFKFTLLDDPEVNAFSHLGGYVYFNKGLLDLQPTDAELQMVIGHEIAHVDLKHCVSQLTYAARASELGGMRAAQLVQLAYQMIAIGYSKDKEFEADAWSYRALRKLGRSKEECLSFLHRLEKLERSRSQGVKSKSEDTLVDKASEQIQNHFRSHPPTTERIQRLEAFP